MEQTISFRTIKFRLAIPANECKLYYQGKINLVSVVSLCNQRLQFPFNTVKKHLTNNGLFGLFEMHFDRQNKFIDVFLIQ